MGNHILKYSLLILFAATASLAVSQPHKTDGFTDSERHDSLVASQLLTQADSLLRIGFHERSRILADSALVVANKQGNKKLQAHCLRTLGGAYSGAGNFPKALNYQYRSLHISEELKDIKSIASELNSLGIIYYTKTVYPKALELLLRSLRLADSIKDTALIMGTLYNLGLVEMEKGDTTKSLEYYRTAYKYGLILDDKRTLALLNNGLGNYYLSVKEYESALTQYSQALSRFSEVKDIVGVSRAYNNIGLLYCSMGEFEKSQKKFGRIPSVKNRN